MAPSASRSRRSRRFWLAAAAPFFDARPIGLQPRGDRLWVPLAGDALGLLRAEPTPPQPGAEVLRVESDAELLEDQPGQARGGPQLGIEPVLRRAVGQPSPDDLLLGERQLGR